MRTIKIIICGKGGVGKTSVLNSLLHDTFDEHSQLTKGVEFHSKEVVMDIKNERYNLVFWDFGGQDRFKKFTDDFVDGSSIAIFVFDTTRFASLDAIGEWLEILDCGANIPILVVGTKIDNLEAESINGLEEMMEDMIHSVDQVYDYKLVSNKTRENVADILGSIVSKLEEIG